ncbi:HNH endonuclease [Nannocystaceae bacterium ST9]
MPGCGRSRHLQAHHVEAWAEGGETSISNLVLLCPGHHGLVHEGKLHVEVRAGKLEFINAHGLPLAPAPNHCIDPEAVAVWLDAADSSSEQTIAWDGSRLDLHEVIGWMMLAEGFRADVGGWG